MEGFVSSTYSYKGFKTDLVGHGTLGFREKTSIDLPTNMRVTTTFRQDWPFTGSAVTSETWLDKRSKRESYTYATLGTASPTAPVFPYVAQSTAESWEYTSASASSPALISSTTTNTYGNYGSNTACSYTAGNCGNPTLVVVATTDGANTWRRTTTSVWVDSAAATATSPGLTDWRLSRLQSASVGADAPGTPSLTRLSAFTYYSDGLLATEVIEPNDPKLKLTTTYTYDPYGNRLTVSQASDAAAVSPYSIAPRAATTYSYDTDARCVTSVKNALNQKETYSYTDPNPSALPYDQRSYKAWCNPQSLTGPNALVTSWFYDWRGRKTLETRADGTTSASGSFFCTDVTGGGTCPAAATYYEVVSSTGSKPAYLYRDVLSREVRTPATC